MMSQKNLLTLALSAFLLVSCNLPARSMTPSPGPQQVYTAAAQTVAASITKIAPTPTSSPRPTDAPVQQNTPLPTQPPVNQPTATAALPCDQAEFVADVTIPDDTVVSPGSNFTKTWRLQNTGSCAWSTAYKLVFVDGDAMNGPAETNLPTSVGSGQVIDLSVTMKAPQEANTYQGFWKLKNASGATFGLKSNNNGPFWVKVKVSGGAAFSVSGVNLAVDTPAYSGACPRTFTLSGTITVTAPGKVTYFWEFDDGTRSALQELVFSAAGSQPVTYSWSLGNSGEYWIKLYVDQPNKQYFPQVSFSATCTP